jgi:hypothetical protein
MYAIPKRTREWLNITGGKLMDSLSHGFWTYYALQKKPFRWSAAIGGMLPDTSMYVFAGYLWGLGQFSILKPWLPQLYRYPAMTVSGSILHSIAVWIVVLLVGLVLGKGWVHWVAIGALGHIAIDMMTHKKFMDQYFWPYSDKRIQGLVDYHDPWFLLINWALIAGLVLSRLFFRDKKQVPTK